MEKERTRKRTSSSVAKAQPLKEIEKYIERWSDAATLDADSYAMRECFRITIPKAALRRDAVTPSCGVRGHPEGKPVRLPAVVAGGGCRFTAATL